MDKLLLEKEVAEFLQVSEEMLKYHRKRNTGPPFVRVGTLIRYRREDIEKWLEERREPVNHKRRSTDINT